MPKRIAMIGAGIVAELYAKAFERGAAGAAFAGVFDPDSGRANGFAQRLKGPAYASREALLADPDVEAVLVLSPNHAHFDDARACLAAGKHVLVEKPVADTAAELRELENLARRLAALYPQDVITGSVIDGELAPPAVTSGGSIQHGVDNRVGRALGVGQIGRYGMENHDAIIIKRNLVVSFDFVQLR